MKEIVKTGGERIDKYLTTIIDESRATINKLIATEKILVNGSAIKASYVLKENDEIDILETKIVLENIEPVKMNLDIVYEDTDIIIVNKQSGLVVHPGAGNRNNTLVNGLMFHTKSLSDLNGDERLGIVHRIDKDTSGILVVAKTNKAHRILAEGFQNKTIRREYIALVNGVFPHETATIDAPIGRDEVDRKMMTVTANNSKDAVTHLKVLKRYKNNTLVSLVLETGRTHQIRVHMKYIGYPIFNDPVYSSKSEDQFGQFLHSSEIDLKHPITGEDLHFKVDLPNYFKDKLEELEDEI